METATTTDVRSGTVVAGAAGRMFAPIAALMDRLHLRQRMLLLGSVGLLATLVTLAFFVPRLGREVEFVRKERVGAQAIGPVVESIAQIQRHRGNMNRLLNGDAGARRAVQTARAGANAAIADLDASVGGPGSALGLGERWTALREGWRALERDSQTLSPAQSFARHTEVAGEVRSLAQRSASAAQDIGRLIQRSVQDIGDATRMAEEAGARMGEVVDSVRDVADIMRAIADASREQAGEIGQISSAIAQMDGNTQQNAALAEEVSAAAGSLEAQVGHLVEAIATFRLPPPAAAQPLSA